VLTDHWLKLFTVCVQLVGIGVLVEILRRLALSAVTVIRAEKKPAAPPTP
jgi:hypothetical protein